MIELANISKRFNHGKPTEVNALNGIDLFMDIGDFVGIKGYLFLTQTGEISVHVQELDILSKSLKPLPVVKRDEDGNIHDGFTDP